MTTNDGWWTGDGQGQPMTGGGSDDELSFGPQVCSNSFLSLDLTNYFSYLFVFRYHSHDEYFFFSFFNTVLAFIYN